MSPKISSIMMEEKKETIIDAAYECFAKTGYVGTSIDDIASQAGSSKGAIYNYFPSKDDIFLTLMKRKCLRARIELFYQFEHFDSANMKLRYLINSGFPVNILGQCWDRVKAEFILCASEKAEFREFWLKENQMLTDIVKTIYEDGIKAGEIDESVDCENMAILFWAFIDSLNVQRLYGIDHADHCGVFRLMEKMFIDNVKAGI